MKCRPSLFSAAFSNPDLVISRNSILHLKLVSASTKQKRRNIYLNYNKKADYIAENYICAEKEIGDLTLLCCHPLLSYNLLLVDKEPIGVELFQNLL